MVWKTLWKMWITLCKCLLRMELCSRFFGDSGDEEWRGSCGTASFFHENRGNFRVKGGQRRRVGFPMVRKNLQVFHRQKRGIRAVYGTNVEHRRSQSWCKVAGERIDGMSVL